MSIRICAAGRWRYSSLSKASSFQPSVLLQYRHQSTQTPHKVIFSGIQPTGVPHLGNYLGALRQWVKLQNDAAPDTRLLFSLVDLHAITVRQDPKQLLQWKNESLAMLLAIGLDPKRCTIFHQSDVSAHSELMWILSGQASTGYLGRMTQWKEKTANEKENSEKLKLNLFSYPVLQAADVLLHRTTHVPVGHDQAQHLEFAREVANGFNHVYGQDILIPPQTLVSPAKRVMSLTHPVSKMSKSHPNPKSRILLTDSDELIQSKIKSAVTDSIEGVTYEQDRRPGVSNLIDILYHTLDESSCGSQQDLAADLANISMRVLKEQVSSAVTKLVAPIRERHESIVGNESLLDDVATLGAAKATESAAPTLLQVKRAVGLCR
ncbi:Tryptophan--tRNA ligase, mitochondrial [Recurvomyces mirabilis]|uniref:Tryptophan--tRNA ligase, mitochondrial n=1 Tax=Recurvomyces mirabilis TaxID=574656 RepID=UPI002DE1B908|nr:Tryptophan--tRNA ligase, mitochondrial [Recurvomyces mirabilis]